MNVAQVNGAPALAGEGWRVEVLAGPPLIAPARQFTFPFAVVGEEGALARGALWLRVRVEGGGVWLAQCALGYVGGGVAHGLWALPGGEHFLACAGGYAYAVSVCAPERTVLLPARPVVGVVALPERTALVGHQGLMVREADGEVWSTSRLSWEGVTVTSVSKNLAEGTGWDMIEDLDVPFVVDLARRSVSGGGFRAD